MNDIKQLLWNGELNVLVSIDPSFLMKGSPREIAVLRIRVPRETYLVNYMPLIWNKIKSFLSFDPLTDSEKYFWFEHNKTPIPWNYPVGVLFDCLAGKSATFTTSFENQVKDVLTFLRIHWLWAIRCHQLSFPSHLAKRKRKSFGFTNGNKFASY